MPVGITSEISKLKIDDSDISRNKIKTYILFFNLFFGALTTVIAIGIFIFSEKISYLLVDSGEYSYILAICVFSSPFVVMFLIIEAFLKGYGLIDVLVKVSVISNIISLSLLVILVFSYYYFGVAIYLFVFGIAPLVIFLIFFRKKLDLNKSQIDISLIKKTEVSSIFKIGTVSLSSSLIHQGAIILLRKFTISHFGYSDNGVYQSVLAISLSYFSIIYIFLSSYSLPSFSKMKDDNELIANININFRFLLLLIIPMIIISFTFREIIIRILYSNNFLSATSLFLPQLIGDLFRAFASLFIIWMIPRLKIKQMIFFDLIFNFILILMPYFLYELFCKSLIIIPLSYLIAFFFHFLMYFIYTKYSLKFKFEILIIKNIFISLVVLSLCLYISILNKEIGYFFSIIMLSSWLLIIFNKEEKKKFALLLMQIKSKIIK